MEKKDKIPFIDRAVNFVAGCFHSTLEDNLKNSYDKGYAEATELGIQNTISALYEAGIKDEHIVRITSNTWKIEENTVVVLLVDIKKYATLNSLRRYLMLKGFSEDKIKEFLRITQAWSKIQKNSDLWVLWKQPEKIYKAVQKYGTKGE